ncbi:MAG: FAD-dependent oxidoreductase, partial [Candidatus Hydrogenedentes bacterium]|nr:FAD-dependent oxidoreductase [Candidatus Hydrogenedentota bacterium]
MKNDTDPSTSIVTRRSALKGLGAVVAAGAIGPIQVASAQDHATVDVVVIGAGASGLMAARSLKKAGRTVVVVEANNRVGGRLK